MQSGLMEELSVGSLLSVLVITVLLLLLVSAPGVVGSGLLKLEYSERVAGLRQSEVPHRPAPGNLDSGATNGAWMRRCYSCR